VNHCFCVKLDLFVIGGDTGLTAVSDVQAGVIMTRGYVVRARVMELVTTVRFYRGRQQQQQKQ
jgi:hypothetical protein